MPVRLGLLVYPLVPILIVVAQRGPVSKLAKAGAFTPETARRLSTIGARGDMDRAVRSGLVVAVGDGRFYVNAQRYHRRLRWMKIAFGVAIVLFIAYLLWRWPPSTW